MKKITVLTVAFLLSACLFAQKSNNKPAATQTASSLSAIKQAVLEQKLAEAKQTITQLEANVNNLQLLLRYEQLRTQLEIAQYDYQDTLIQIYNNNGTKQITILFNRGNPCNACVNLFLNDTIKLKKVFPFIYNGIKNGSIRLDTNYVVIFPQSQVPSLIEIPPYIDRTSPNIKAAEYLNIISQINGLKLFDFDVVKAYQKIENAETNKSLANLIQLRKEYIDYLKTAHNEKK